MTGCVSCNRGDINETTRRACGSRRNAGLREPAAPGNRAGRGQDAEIHPGRQSAEPRSDLVHHHGGPQFRLHDLGHAVRLGRHPGTETADGRGPCDRGRRPDVALPPARRPKIPRRLAGARGGLRRIDPALDEARRLRAAHRGLAERTRRHRRPQLRVPPEEAVPAARARPRQTHRQCLLHHAGADREDRPLQADRRIHRLRSLRVQSQRMDPGRARHVQALRRLRAAAGAAELRRRRQAGELRPHRVEHHHRRRHVFRRHPVGRGGVVADAHRRSAAAAAQGARRGGGTARRFRRRGLHALQHAASAVRQREAAPRSAAGDQSGGFHERRDGWRSGDHAASASACSRLARRSPTLRGWRR